MSVRIATQTQINQTVARIRDQSSILGKYQDQISSGVRLTKSSDNPSDFAVVSRNTAALNRLTAYTQTTTDATSDLNAGVAALQDGNQVLTRARQLAQQGVDGSTDQPGYEALASEVDGLLSRLVATANSQFDGHYLFSGTQTGTQPFTVSATDSAGRPAAIAYNGSPDRTQGLIGPGDSVATRYAGSQVFQSPGADAFTALMGLRDDLRSTTLTGPAKAQALSQRLATLTAASDGLNNTIGEQSASLANLDALQSRMADVQLSTQSRIGDLQSTDYADAIVKMQQQQTLLQASLTISSKLLQPNLLEFIR